MTTTQGKKVPLEVREWMKGYISLGAKDYDDGFIGGIDADGRFEHEMLIRIDDIDRFASDPQHEARLDGSLTCPLLGGTFAVENGVFKMFVDSAKPGLKFMRYRMPYRDQQGRVRTVLGHKTIHDDKSLDLWPDTTTLYVKVLEGLATTDDAAGTPLAMGTIHIEKIDLIRSIRSFRSPGSNLGDTAHAKAVFAKFFFGNVWEVYGPKL